MSQTNVITGGTLENTQQCFPSAAALGIDSNLEPTHRPLVYWPDSRLSNKCEDVTIFDEEVEQLVYDLVLAMRTRDGIGLAAPQLGRQLNVIVIEQLWEGKNHPLALINPVVIDVDDSISFTTNEGCLSVPGYYEERSRPYSVVVEYYNPTGNEKVIELQNMNAFVLQHELDHLYGKVFVDGLSKLKQGRILNKVKKTRKFGK